MIKVKICGLTNKEDALKACEDGADMVGFIFAKESPRCLSPKVIREIIEALPGSVGKVGLFKDEDPHEVREAVISCGLDHVQLHGGESPEYCGALKDGLRRDGIALTVIKTFKVRDRIPGDVSEYSSAADFNLFDTYHPVMMGGTGTTFDWGVLAGIKSDRPFFLAGGLTPENVASAVRRVRPYAVDVASGVEVSVGKKDHYKVKEFIKNAKNA